MAVPEPFEFARKLPRKPGDPTIPCAHATEFEQHAGELITQLLAKIERVPADQRQAPIQQLKAHILDEYRTSRLKAHPRHTNEAGRRKHVCLPERLDQVLAQIADVERRFITKEIDVRRKAPAAGDDRPLLAFGIEYEGR